MWEQGFFELGRPGKLKRYLGLLSAQTLKEVVMKMIYL